MCTSALGSASGLVGTMVIAKNVNLVRPIFKVNDGNYLLFTMLG